MKLILISKPIHNFGEHELINRLFEEGLEYFHLRKPVYSKEEILHYIKNISPLNYKKISLHSHYELIEKYNFGGIHLTGLGLKNIDTAEIKEVLKIAQRKGLRITTSAHSIEEIENLNFRFDYIFLSPIFDSISKQGYDSGFEKEKIEKFLQNKDRKAKVIALGGVEENKIAEIMEMRFDGCAILGAIWEGYSQDLDVEKSVEKFKAIQSKTKAPVA